MLEQNGHWYQHSLLTLFAIFYENNTEETNFWIIVIYALHNLYNVHVLHCIPGRGSPYICLYVRFELVKLQKALR